MSLKGWRRVWNHRVAHSDARQGCTSLSIEPAQAIIDGVLVRMPVCELETLDAREYGYERMCLEATDFILPAGISVDTIYVYRSLQTNRHLADTRHPVAQSYVDCVMAGYLKRFGDDGLMRFLESTRGWDLPTLADRKEPTYPRSVDLSLEQQIHFDSLLAPLR